MKKRISLCVVFIMVVCYALLEWKYSTKELSVIIPYQQLVQLSPQDRHSVLAQEIFLSFNDSTEYTSLLKLGLKASRLVYVQDGSSKFYSGLSAAGIFVSEYKEGSIQIDRKTVSDAKSFDIAFSAEIMNHHPISPVDAYGIRLKWIHFMRAQEVDKLSTDQIQQRIKRALIERNIRALFFNFSKKLSWAQFVKTSLKGYKLSLAPRRVFFNWDRVRLLFSCLFIIVLALECKWILLVLLGLLIEYPTNVQVSGFLFVQISVLHLYFTYVRGLKNEKEVLLLLRLLPLWGKAILFAFTYYFLMDYQDFDQRFYLARGVKISLLFLPACIFIYEIVVNYKSIFNAKKSDILKGGVGLLFLILVGYIVMVRSGNSPSLEPSQFELFLRTNLENIFLARPRFKELIGLFSLVLFYIGLKNRNYSFELISKLLFCLYLTTFFNSFSHFHTSFWFVCLREVNTLLLGVLPLLALTIIDVYWLRPRNASVHLGYFGFNNFGDELLKLTLIQEDKKNKDRYIVKSYSSNSHQKREILRSSYEETFVSFTNVKTMSLGPGGVLQDSTSSLSMYYYVFYCAIAKVLGAKVTWNHIGFSPLRRSLNKLLIVALVKVVDEISVRDEDSFAYLEGLGVSTSKLYLKRDLVYDYNISSVKFAKEDHLAIILRSWKGAPLKSWISEIATTGYRRVYFIFQKDEYLKKLIDECDPKAIVKEYSGEPQAYYRELSRFKKIVSMRFHGLVLGEIFGSDLFALNYDMKCQTFCEEKNIISHIREKEFKDLIMFSSKLKKFIGKR